MTVWGGKEYLARTQREMKVCRNARETEQPSCPSLHMTLRVSIPYFMRKCLSLICSYVQLGFEDGNAEAEFRDFSSRSKSRAG